MKIQKSAEDYLETILILSEKNGEVRSVDIAEQLGVTKPSVSYAIKRLRENGYIVWNEEKHISLTESGLSIASDIYTRHKRLIDLFVALGVDLETATKDAHKVEHDLSDVTFEAICRYSINHLHQVHNDCLQYCKNPQADCLEEKKLTLI